MASVFDQERLAWVDQMPTVCRHKIASRSIRDTALINAIIDTGKPVIISLGMWDRVEFPDFVSSLAKSITCIVFQITLPHLKICKYK